MTMKSSINLSIPIVKSYSGTGTFFYSGNYPPYIALLSDVPYEGFKSNFVIILQISLNMK
jgi:hypothetical protein